MGDANAVRVDRVDPKACAYAVDDRASQEGACIRTYVLVHLPKRVAVRDMDMCSKAPAVGPWSRAMPRGPKGRVELEVLCLERGLGHLLVKASGEIWMHPCGFNE